MNQEPFQGGEAPDPLKSKIVKVDPETRKTILENERWGGGKVSLTEKSLSSLAFSQNYQRGTTLLHTVTNFREG